MISSSVKAPQGANYVDNVTFALARERLPRTRQLIFASFVNVAGRGLPLGPGSEEDRLSFKAASSSRRTLGRAAPMP
jgi:hypothetical protein